MIQLRALGLYAGLTLPLAILSHVVAEAVALHETVVDAAGNPIHAYLGVVAIACLALIATALVRVRGDLRRLVGLLANALPFKGEGMRFGAMSAAVQFGFAGLTLFGEGSLDPASVLTALIAVATASVAVSALLAIVRARLDHSFECRFVARNTSCVLAPEPRPFAVLARPFKMDVPTYGNRPPPLK